MCCSPLFWGTFAHASEDGHALNGIYTFRIPQHLSLISPAKCLWHTRRSHCLSAFGFQIRAEGHEAPPLVSAGDMYGRCTEALSHLCLYGMEGRGESFDSASTTVRTAWHRR